MNFKVLDLDKYYRKDIYNHFTKDCKCSVSITDKIDVTSLIDYSKRTNTKFYINFLYCLGKTLNSEDDYKSAYLWKEGKVVIFDKINIAHYIFHDDTKTCTMAYTEYFSDYKKFYMNCSEDIKEAKEKKGLCLDTDNHLNYFEASYISWISYESLNIELPDGYLYFQPIINWGRYKEEGDKYLMPVTIRMNHAIADGYLISNAFLTLEKNIAELVNNK